MKAVVLVTLLAGLTWPAVGLAQDAAASTAAGASVALSADLDSVDELAAHLAVSTTVDLAAVTDPAKIHIVKVSTLEASASGNMDSFKAALTTNSANLTTLRGAVTANTVISTKLQAEGFTANDVVAVVHNEPDGSLTIYVDDSAMRTGGATTGAAAGGTVVGGATVSAEDLPKVQAACNTLAAKEKGGDASTADTATDTEAGTDAEASSDATTGDTDAGIDAATTTSIDLAILTYESCKEAGLVD